jgi:hypothetical protein
MTEFEKFKILVDDLNFNSYFIIKFKLFESSIEIRPMY